MNNGECKGRDVLGYESAQSIMILKIKILISTFLTLPIFGRLASIISKDISFRGIKISNANPYLSYKTKAKLFWNLYESAEARLINKYLNSDYDVVELGASLGIISTLIAGNTKKQLICVEPNISLIPSIEFNLKHVGFQTYSIVNAGLSYSNDPIKFDFNPEDNLIGKLSQTGGYDVNKITLAEIVQRFNIREFILVADIEGSEVEFLINDVHSLEKCALMIMELHNTEYNNVIYSVEDLIKLIRNAGFVLVERDGNCVAFSKGMKKG